MSKPGKKKAKSQARRANSKFASHNLSMLDHHQRVGSKLIPPLAQLPKMATSSWVDHHMPEMLWAVLLAGTMERRHYLNCLRRIAVVCREWFLKSDQTADADADAKDEAEAEAEAAGDTEAGLDFKVIVDHTKLAEVSDQEFKKWAAAGFKDTLLRWKMKPEVVHGEKKDIQPRVQARGGQAGH